MNFLQIRDTNSTEQRESRKFKLGEYSTKGSNNKQHFDERHNLKHVMPIHASTGEIIL